MAHAIEVTGLTKRFGPVLAVDELSFTADEGRVVGFLGPNGAGKTTTLRMLLGLVNPTAGDATVHGRRYVELDDPVHTVGAVLDGGMLHPGRSGRNHLRALAQAVGVADARVEELLELVALKDAGQPPRRRLLARACASGSGWRPRCSATRRCSCSTSRPTAWTRRASAGCATSCAALAGEGRAVLVSSHVLAEVAQTADDVVVIDRGRSVAQAPLAEIMARGGGGMRVAGPDVGRLGELLHGQGAKVSGDARRDPRQRAQRRADRPPGRRAPARDLRALAGRHLAGGDLLRAHRRPGRPVVIRLVGSEFFKLRTHAHVLRARRRARSGSCC